MALDRPVHTHEAAAVVTGGLYEGWIWAQQSAPAHLLNPAYCTHPQGPVVEWSALRRIRIRAVGRHGFGSNFRHLRPHPGSGRCHSRQAVRRQRLRRCYRHAPWWNNGGPDPFREEHPCAEGRRLPGADRPGADPSQQQSERPAERRLRRSRKPRPRWLNFNPGPPLADRPWSLGPTRHPYPQARSIPGPGEVTRHDRSHPPGQPATYCVDRRTNLAIGPGPSGRSPRNPKVSLAEGVSLVWR